MSKQSYIILLTITAGIIYGLYFNLYTANSNYHEFITEFVPLGIQENIYLKEPEDVALCHNKRYLELEKPYLKANHNDPAFHPDKNSFTYAILLDLVQKQNLESSFLDIVQNDFNNLKCEINDFHKPLKSNLGTDSHKDLEANILVNNVLNYYRITLDKQWLKEVGLKIALASYQSWAKIEKNKESYRKLYLHSQAIEELLEIYKILDTPKTNLKWQRLYKEQDLIREIIKTEIFKLKTKNNLDIDGGFLYLAASELVDFRKDENLEPLMESYKSLKDLNSELDTIDRFFYYKILLRLSSSIESGKLRESYALKKFAIQIAKVFMEQEYQRWLKNKDNLDYRLTTNTLATILYFDQELS